MIYIKYPRTPHLPWSPGATKDDRILNSVEHFTHHYVVVTEKRDGENTTLYQDHIHARSIDSKDHISRHYVKALHARIRNMIRDGWRICGENLHYEKSIHYNDLTDFFEVFSIWDNNNICLSWGETGEWCEILGLTPVPVLWQGTWDLKALRNLQLDLDKQEGYVVRSIYGFPYEQFDKHIAKFVRKNHVQTDEHWMHQQLVKNELKSKED